MDNLEVNNLYSTTREDGQRCPVAIDTDYGTGEQHARQKSAPFYAFNKQNYKAKVKLGMEEPVANSILEFFVSEMDGTNAICISMKALEKLFKLKRNAISKHIKVLVKRNFVEVYKSGNQNIYAVNAFIVWTQGDASLWKAKFSATMYLDFDEQTSIIKRTYTKQVDTKK